MTRRVYRKRTHPSMRTARVLKIIYYRHFKLSLVDNGFYGWKYEWRVEPTDSVTLRLLRKEKRATDPTSSRHRRMSLDYGKICINELHHPRWYLR